MSLSIVRNHLLTTLKGVTPLRVVVEGENFTPKGLQDYPFVRFQFLPRETQFTTNGYVQEAGLVAITYYFSRNVNSIDAALEVAEEIKHAFPVQNTALDDMNQLIVERSWIEAARHEDNVVGIPIFVRWVNPSMQVH